MSQHQLAAVAYVQTHPDEFIPGRAVLGAPNPVLYAEIQAMRNAQPVQPTRIRDRIEMERLNKALAALRMEKGVAAGQQPAAPPNTRVVEVEQELVKTQTQMQTAIAERNMIRQQAQALSTRLDHETKTNGTHADRLKQLDEELKTARTKLQQSVDKKTHDDLTQQMETRRDQYALLFQSQQKAVQEALTAKQDLQAAEARIGQFKSHEQQLQEELKQAKQEVQSVRAKQQQTQSEWKKAQEDKAEHDRIVGEEVQRKQAEFDQKLNDMQQTANKAAQKKQTEHEQALKAAHDRLAAATAQKATLDTEKATLAQRTKTLEDRIASQDTLVEQAAKRKQTEHDQALKAAKDQLAATTSQKVAFEKEKTELAERIAKQIEMSDKAIRDAQDIANRSAQEHTNMIGLVQSNAMKAALATTALDNLKKDLEMLSLQSKIIMRDKDATTVETLLHKDVLDIEGRVKRLSDHESVPYTDDELKSVANLRLQTDVLFARYGALRAFWMREFGDPANMAYEIDLNKTPEWVAMAQKTDSDLTQLLQMYNHTHRYMNRIHTLSNGAVPQADIDRMQTEIMDALQLDRSEIIPVTTGDKSDPQYTFGDRQGNILTHLPRSTPSVRLLTAYQTLLQWQLATNDAYIQKQDDAERAKRLQQLIMHPAAAVPGLLPAPAPAPGQSPRLSPATAPTTVAVSTPPVKPGTDRWANPRTARKLSFTAEPASSQDSGLSMAPAPTTPHSKGPRDMIDSPSDSPGGPLFQKLPGGKRLTSVASGSRIPNRYTAQDPSKLGKHKKVTDPDPKSKQEREAAALSLGPIVTDMQDAIQRGMRWRSEDNPELKIAGPMLTAAARSGLAAYNTLVDNKVVDRRSGAVLPPHTLTQMPPHKLMLGTKPEMSMARQAELLRAYETVTNFRETVGNIDTQVQVRNFRKKEQMYSPKHHPTNWLAQWIQGVIVSRIGPVDTTNHKRKERDWSQHYAPANNHLLGIASFYDSVANGSRAY